MFVDVSKPEKSVKDDFLCTILLMLLATQINRRRDNMQKSSLVIVSPEWRHTAYLYIYIYVFFGGALRDTASCGSFNQNSKRLKWVKHLLEAVHKRREKKEWTEEGKRDQKVCGE